jgi:ATP-dependent DNA helicase PIF1
MTDREELSAEQRAVLDDVLAGNNVFFTGNAGTGKTFLLKQVVKVLREKYGNAFGEKVAVVATTGIAATHISGTTINAALGIGAPSLYRDFRLMHRNDNKNRIRRWEVMVIDECSMLSAEFFQEVECMLREVRDSGLPAGGLQLVVTGDFFQLPPVTRSLVPDTARDAFLNFGYAFQSPAWYRCRMKTSLLTKIYRQTDAEFMALLDAIRDGKRPAVSKAVRRLVELCRRPIDHVDGVKPTQIFSKNKDVDEMNAVELARLTSTKILFGSKDDIIVDAHLKEPGAEKDFGVALVKLKRNEFFRDCMAPPMLRLCVGAQVMLLKNLDTSANLVNGSRGVVVGFATAAGPSGGGASVPIVQFTDGTRMEIPPTKFSSAVHGMGECVRVQVPLKLAWAITVHKSQGMTLDLVRVSLRSMFVVGQAYVALSRARTLEGLEIIDWEEGCARSDPAVSEFQATLTGEAVETVEGDDPRWAAWQQQRIAMAPKAVRG